MLLQQFPLSRFARPKRRVARSITVGHSCTSGTNLSLPLWIGRWWGRGRRRWWRLPTPFQGLTTFLQRLPLFATIPVGCGHFLLPGFPDPPLFFGCGGGGGGFAFPVFGCRPSVTSRPRPPRFSVILCYSSLFFAADLPSWNAVYAVGFEKQISDSFIPNLTRALTPCELIAQVKVALAGVRWYETVFVVQCHCTHPVIQVHCICCRFARTSNATLKVRGLIA